MKQTRKRKGTSLDSAKKKDIKENNRRTVSVTPRLLRRWSLPQHNAEGDKEERGSVLVVGGASEMPGAIVLAATAALRAGAGKLQIATVRSIAQLVAASVPEARVFALRETKSGAFAASAVEEVVERANRVQSALFGPGMIDEPAVARLMQNILPLIERPTLILDAAALSLLTDYPHVLYHLHNRVVITPHAGEMASVLGIDKNSILRAPRETAQRAATELRAIVALKGAETFIAAPASDKVYCNHTGNIGLATSGSGDTLSGIIAGLAARGAAPVQAAVWGVHLHAAAGDALARRIGRLGRVCKLHTIGNERVR